MGKTGQANSCYRYFPGCATTYRREMRRQLPHAVCNLVLINTNMALIFLGHIASHYKELQSFISSVQNLFSRNVTILFFVRM